MYPYRQVSQSLQTSFHPSSDRLNLFQTFANQNTKPSEDQIKFVVWCLERTIDLMPPGVESLTLLIDFGSSKVPNASGQPTTLSQAKQVLNILQTYYCERLGRAVLINVPWLFWGFYKLVKPFMDPRTAEKIKFNPDVTELVPVEQLEKSCFGGQLEFEYDHETYFPLLIELTAQRRKQMLARYHRIGPNSIGLSEYELRGGKSESSAEDDNSSTCSPKGEGAESVLRRPRFRHHAETDAGDSVYSDRPPSGSQKSGNEGTGQPSNDPESAAIQDNSTSPKPSSPSSPSSPKLDEPIKSVAQNHQSTEPIIGENLPPNRTDSMTSERKSNEKSEPNSKPNSSKLSQRFGSMKSTVASHFKQHQEEDKDKKRFKKENKAIANGLQVEADELGRPLTDQVGASRKVSRILAK
ncbi:CRAL-TRIO domain-containing protein [Melampsora americana]|nr:CRAL-TRIO domain-containing protein [Melampsora americana]